MVSTASDRPASEQLLELAKGLGVDLTSLGGSSAGPDPKDPPVFFGSQPVPAPPRPKPRPGQPRYGDDYRQPTSSRSSDVVKALSQANAAFYEMDEQEVATLQRRLIAAGILDPKRTRLGDYDDDTYSAFAAINERAAKFNAVGKKLTPNDVLSMIERTAAESGLLEEPDEPGTVSATTDRVSLEEQVQSAARQNLGRKLRPSEVSKFVTLYQGMEGSFNSTANAMQRAAEASGQDASLERIPSADVAAQQFIESTPELAQEAAGQSSYAYLEALRDLLG